MYTFGPFQSLTATLSRPSTEEKAGLNAPEEWLYDIFGAASAAGSISVTPQTAMRCTAVRCAVQTIAEAIGQLPVIVYQRKETGGKERAADHPAYSILHDAVNDFTSASELKESLIRDALLYGHGVALITRINGSPVELNRVHPASVEPLIDDRTYEPVYRIHDAMGGHRDFHYADVFVIRAPDDVAVIHHAKEAIALALQLEAHAARLFRNGARPGGVLTFPGRLSGEVVKRIATSWKAAHGGANSGSTAILEEGGTFTGLTFNSVDSQFLELREFAVQEIARAFRVSPILLHHLNRATYANSEELALQFLKFTLMPWIKKFEGEARLKLLDPTERKTHTIEFLLDDLQRADLATRAEAYSKLIAARVLNPNEIRAMENRPPYDGGDEFLNPNTTSGNPTSGNPT